MRHLGIGGGIAVAIATVFAFSHNISPSVLAQEQAAISPELAAKGVWSSATTYAKDDIVTARGSAWISLKAGNTNHVPGQTQPSSATFWRLFARGFNPTGAWSNATKYQPDDLVTSGGQTYRAKLTHTNRPLNNMTFWELFAARGAAGPSTLAAGSEGAPSIKFSGDTDTGIYSPGAGKIALVENSTKILHTGAANSGNVVFGGLALNNSAALDSVAIGDLALNSSSGNSNVAVGKKALLNNGGGSDNVAVGQETLLGGTGSQNVAVGTKALYATIGGSNNIAIGYHAGITPNASTNGIYIGNDGLLADTDLMRIGTPGSQLKTFIAGIAGVTVSNNAAVLIDTTTGQLGTVNSSRRYKENVAPMPDMSAMLAKLQPVTFHYKKPYVDGPKPMEYGLIAEEVAEVFPDLAVFNMDGQPETVKYHLLPTFLLAGYQAQQKTIAAQAGKIEALEERLAKLEAALPRVKEASVR